MDDTLSDYELTFEERPHYLYAHLKADAMTPATAIEYLTKVAERCHAIKCRRVMLERDVPGALTVVQTHFMVNEFIRMAGEVTVALVNQHLANVDAMELALLMSTNRGANHRLFDNVASAEAWLLQGVKTGAAKAEDTD